ncbi:MAG: autotransporter outer membrane beta-barrel domain-containing protein [Magnetococcales bacterium]|nr:autotransporter outer membrane beta-barrel domain-containing protein [Magnetococcales bacterium]
MTDNSALWNFSAVINGNDVDVIASSVQLTDTSSDPQAKDAARILAILGNGSNADMNTVIAALQGLGSSAETTRAVKQTLPILTGELSQATSNAMRGINRIVQSRQESNKGLSAGDEILTSGHVWAKSFVGKTRQSEHKGVSGYDATSSGLVLGFDKEVDEKHRLGVALAYAYSDIEGAMLATPQAAQVSTVQLIGYGSRNLDAVTELNFQLDASYHWNQGDRTINFGGLNRVAQASYGSYSGHLGLGLGRIYAVSETTQLVPSLRSDFSASYNQAYHESGAGALNLHVEASDSSEWIFSVDSKLNHKVDAATTLAVNLGAGYDFLADSGMVSAAYASAPSAAFHTPGLETPPWLGRGGLGLTYRHESGMEINARYDAETRNDYVSQMASMKVRWAF